MSRDAIQLMKAFFLPDPGDRVEENWRPATDVYRTPEGWLVKIDLAGVEPGEVQLAVEGRNLTIRGQRRDWCLTEGCRQYLMEIAYSRFERTLVLPDDLRRVRISTEFRMGFLLIRLRKESEP